MRRLIQHKLVELDMFGYPIPLYYHDDSQVKKSAIGLLFTFIMLVLSAIYMTQLVHHIGNDKHQSVIHYEYKIFDLNEQSVVHLNDQEIRFFAHLYKDHEEIEFLTDIERYVNISFPSFVRRLEHWHIQIVKSLFEKMQTARLWLRFPK